MGRASRRVNKGKFGVGLCVLYRALGSERQMYRVPERGSAFLGRSYWAFEHSISIGDRVLDLRSQRRAALRFIIISNPLRLNASTKPLRRPAFEVR